MAVSHSYGLSGSWCYWMSTTVIWPRPAPCSFVCAGTTCFGHVLWLVGKLVTSCTAFQVNLNYHKLSWGQAESCSKDLLCMLHGFCRRASLQAQACHCTYTTFAASSLKQTCCACTVPKFRHRRGLATLDLQFGQDLPGSSSLLTWTTVHWCHSICIAL